MFKKAITALTMSAALMTATASSVAMAEGQKIGVIDMPTIFQQLPQRDLVAQLLEAEFKERVDGLHKIEESMKTLVEKQKRDGALMTEQQKTDMIREMESLRADYQLKRKALEEDNRRRQSEERNKLLIKVQRAVNEVAESEKYDVILQSTAVAFINKSNDISAKIVEKVSKSK